MYLKGKVGSYLWACLEDKAFCTLQMEPHASGVNVLGEFNSSLLRRRLKRGARSSVVRPSRGLIQLIALQSWCSSCKVFGLSLMDICCGTIVLSVIESPRYFHWLVFALFPAGSQILLLAEQILSFLESNPGRIDLGSRLECHPYSVIWLTSGQLFELELKPAQCTTGKWLDYFSSLVGVLASGTIAWGPACLLMVLKRQTLGHRSGVGGSEKSNL